jgi:hypothetical protein
MTSLLDFCITARQQDIIELHLQGLSSREIARKLNLSDRHSANIREAIRTVKRRAEDRGYAPEQHRNIVLPPSQVVSGYSDLVRYPADDPLGRIVGWIKSNRKLASQLDDAKALIDAMSVEIPRVKPTRYEGRSHSPHAFTVIPIGDPHIGLCTWSNEVGVEWDIPIALRVYQEVFSRLFSRAPDTDVAVIFNSGDFFHADNIAGETTRSRHKLDLDGKPGYWLDAGFTLTRLLIDIALHKYKEVVYINTPGNHDDILGLALGRFVTHLYEKEPRLQCLPGDNLFQYYERGKVALGFCHGHTCNVKALPGKMADDQAEMWGRTRLRHWFTGHVHHNQWQQWKEHPGATVESVGIIPPKDAYAHGAGYGAGRGTQAIIFDDRGYTTDRYVEHVRPED